MELLQSRWEADEFACWAHRRAHVYRLLSAGFGPPTPFLRRLLSTGEFLGYLRQALDAAPGLFQGPLGEMERFFRIQNPAGAVEAEFHRLFPGRVSLRGSDHGGPAPRKVKKFYRDAEMALVVSPLPADHVSVEAAFLGALAEQEMWLRRRGLPEEAKGAGEEAGRFLGGCMVPWVPRFALRVEAEPASPFYGALARVLDGWVALEGKAFPP